MTEVLVVGSGASGTHFALSLVRKGYRVTMIDVGHERSASPLPHANLDQLKERLTDPTAYFLGSRYEGVVLPDFDREYYAIPPSKDYVFKQPPDFGYFGTGFAPLFSFARGGLAEAWTGGCYPFNDEELREFPFSYSDMAPHYAEVARRIGISGAEDDLSPFMPLHDHLLAPLELDLHSNTLYRAYQRRRADLNKRLGFYLGRTRIAVLSRGLGSRQACEYLGRCLWGCPIEALYTPIQTLRECMSYRNFTYVPGMQVKHFRVNNGSRITGVVVAPVDGGSEQELRVNRLVLAAGTLSTARIVLWSAFRETGKPLRLHGLMDNRQVLVPFVNLRMIGQPFRADSYQYHLLSVGLKSSDGGAYVHGQITTLKGAAMHPFIQRLPFDLKTSTHLARAMHAALGLVNVNFHDRRRDENYVTLSVERNGVLPALAIHYRPPDGEPAQIQRSIRKVRKALWKLGCVIPPGMVHVRPMGASVHYAGTLPMSRRSASWTTTEHGQSRDFENLFIVDGSTFPYLPAKNLTFTLMANAVRVAETGF